ncbi:MAG: IS66 family transposase [Methylohalobius crimeensis]
MSTAQSCQLSSLPDDIEALKQLVLDQQQALVQKEQTIVNREQRIAVLEEFIRLEKLRRFAARSEKAPSQQELFNEAELSVAAEEALSPQEAQQQADPGSTKKPSRPKPRRKPLPPEFPRVRVAHEVPAADRQCSCGGERTAIGEETSEQLDIIPAKVRVLVNVRTKYACRQCENGVQTAPLPAQPIPKSKASPGLLAHVAVAKYQDALPLYRQEALLKRSGVELPRHTLANWMIKAGQLVQPLINLLADALPSYPVLQCDETRVQVLKEPDKPPTRHSYMWVRAGGPPTQPIRLFHYADSRRGEVAQQLLGDYQGYLQTDDYGGYHACGALQGVTHLGCWAHARRKFVDAQKASASAKSKTGKADLAVNMIGKLYAIERRIKDLASEQRYEIRQQEAVPQLAKIRQWLDKTLHTTLPKGLLGKALAYLDKNWNKLTIYTEDGRLSIDNNTAENAIRPFVLGRKNWLFSATVPGAKASANLYSLIETAKANGLEPYAYLCQVFKELPRASTVDQIESLLPWNLDQASLSTE